MSFPISNERQFGFVIAYLIPGFIVVNGIGEVSPTVANWLAVSTNPTIGGFFYIVLLSLLVGLTCSTVRWLCLDSFHRWRGLKPTKWEMERLSKNIEAFDLIVSYHYRYYQFYGNVLVAVPVTLALFGYTSGPSQIESITIVIVVAFELLFFVGSNDSFRKYVHRSNELLEAKSRLISN